MKMDNVIFDLDDFSSQEEFNCMDVLLDLKEKFPQLKVNLFAVPFHKGVFQDDFFKKIVKHHGDWIQLCVHGWRHDTNFESSVWTWQEAKKALEEAEKMGVFQKVFKAPGWQISRDTYNVLKNMGYVCADHKFSAYTEPGVPNSERRPKMLRIYEIDHPWMVHGHTWNCEGNGIYELMEKWEKDGYPWADDVVFKFITEMDL